jgi:hypothetical protein
MSKLPMISGVVLVVCMVLVLVMQVFDLAVFGWM